MRMLASPRRMSTGAGTQRIEQLSPPAEIGFPGDWYELNSADHFWFQWRLRAALRQWRDVGLPLGQPLRVLDVGGGRGVLRDQVEAATAWTVDLVELNLLALQQAEPGRGRHLYYDVRDRSADLVGTYDAAILFDVIEHLEQTQPVLEAARQHLRPGGLLILNVPAWQGLFSAYDVAAGHFRRYDRRTLAAELPAAHWEIVDQRYWGLTLVPLLMVRKLLLRSPDAETIRRGFGPPSRFVHGCLRGLMRTDMALAPRPPFGASLLMVARRRDAG
jgi:SAM-dependent methyltransferase